MRYAPVSLMPAGDMSGNLASNGVDVNQIFMFSIQAVFTGAPVGSLKVQVSNDDVPDAPGSNPSANVVNWVDYTGSATAVSGSGNFMWIISNGGYKWVRIAYTFTSGTGSLSLLYSGKGV